MRIYVSGDKRIEWSVIEVDAEDLCSAFSYSIYEYSVFPNFNGDHAFNFGFDEYGSIYWSILGTIHTLARIHPEKVVE